MIPYYDLLINVLEIDDLTKKLRTNTHLFESRTHRKFKLMWTRRIKLDFTLNLRSTYDLHTRL